MSLEIIRREAIELWAGAFDFITNPAYGPMVSWIILGVDTVFSMLIIRTVPYTEIDWQSYMQQIQIFMSGERDYMKISGDTGPLVYPAMHVYIYRALYTLTQEGTNVTLAQVYHGILYIYNLAMVMASYRLANVSPWVYPMLMLSKRLHSIYLLRCFNDCWAMCGLLTAIYLYQKKEWSWGSFAYALGLGVKMNLLLVLPAILLILYQAQGPTGLWRHILIITQVQVLIGLPFMRVNGWGYLARAFDFTRQFKYEWTVNWKFLTEETFLSREFSLSLLGIHAALLLMFIITRWLKPVNRSPREFFRVMFTSVSDDVLAAVNKRITPDFVLTSILTANAIGMLCARSLHFQFFSWIGWATPFLLWRAQLSPLLVIFLWSGQELAWNRFPPDELSSKIVIGVLAAVVVQIWLATDDEVPTKDKETVGPVPGLDAKKESKKAR